MKLFNFKTIFAFAAGCAALCSAACSDDDGIDNRERDYGYIQFKIYKEASYPGAPASQSRAVVDELDYLHTARKLSVELRSGNTSIVQTMVLSAADNQSAEFGLRSDKLQLLAGEYQIVSFSLYDVDDEEIYRGTPDHSNNNNIVNIVAGGLTVHDLTANVAPRGKVRFNLIKDISQLTGEWKSRASSRNREYTFDEIAYFDVTEEIRTSDENCGRRLYYEGLPVTNVAFVLPIFYLVATMFAPNSPGWNAVMLAGYLSMLPENLIRAYQDRIINIHPSLIPSFCGKGFYGLNVHRAAIEYGVKISGLTVHFVDEHYDSGAIILQRAVPVLEGDTPETLQARILEEEHKALPLAVRLLTTGKLVKEGRKVTILQETSAAAEK